MSYRKGGPYYTSVSLTYKAIQLSSEPMHTESTHPVLKCEILEMNERR